MYRFKIRGEVIRFLGDTFLIEDKAYKLYRIVVGSTTFKALFLIDILPEEDFQFFESKNVVITKQETVEGTEEVVLRIDMLRVLQVEEYKPLKSLHVKVNGLVREFGPLKKVTVNEQETVLCPFHISVKDSLSKKLYTLHAVAFGEIAEELSTTQPEVFLNIHADIQIGCRLGIELRVTNYKIIERREQHE